MGGWRACRSWLFMSVVALASGCVSLPAPLTVKSQVPATLIGTVGVSGEDVRINGEMAGSGDAVTEGDTVVTGPYSSAVIDFIDGGYIHLDQDSKAIFVKKQLRRGTCNMAHMLNGQAFLDKDPFCLETPHLEALSTSLANVRVTTEQTEIVVLRGKLTLKRPQPMEIKEFQQAVVSKSDTAVNISDLTSSMALEFPDWRRPYRFFGYCCKRSVVLTAADRDRCELSNFSFIREQVVALCK